MKIRAAIPDEAKTLSDLAFRSKAYWGYSDEFMEACRDELSVSESKINNSDYIHFVGVQQEEIIGYYAFEKCSQEHFDLHALFIDPIHIGKGFGKLFMKHAIGIAHHHGVVRVTIQSDPQAADFYRSIGARQIGEIESGSVAGRYLPEFELTTKSANASQL